MNKGFWGKLEKPFFVLAPMADVTDAAFRRLIAKYGKPDVMFTEFVSADGLFLGGEDALMKDLEYSEEERPIVAQFFTSKPELMERAARLALKLGFDGVDINMGCPDKSIERQGAGAALIKNPSLASLLIDAAVRGAEDLPVSVKTRIGYNKNELEEWLPVLLKKDVAAVTIHARTRREMSKVPADWNCIKRAVEIRDSMGSSSYILGNGDVTNFDEGNGKVNDTGADGVMFGRAIFGSPWFFNKHRKDISVKERLETMIEHTKLYEELLPEKNFAIMKKHYKAYINGWQGAKELRTALMEANNADEVALVTEKYLSTL